MKHHLEISPSPHPNSPSPHPESPRPRKRLGLLAGAILLVFALGASACSSDNSASQAATATATPVTPTVGTSPTTDPGASGQATPTTEPGALAPATTSDVDVFLDELDDRGFGGVVAVRDGANITTRAYGMADRENGVPIDVETVFDIASVTKPFTAAAILRLEMDGLLSVEDTLGQHVPGLPDDKAAITLHQLLTHTAGVPRDLGDDYDPVGRSDFLTLFAETPLTSAPGDRYEYSNAGYSLLTAVIEFEAGESYEAYLQQALFEPAGMFDTGYLLPDWDDHTIAVGYSDPSGDRFGRPNEQAWGADGPYWHLRGNGGLLSTAADMLRWDEALMGDRVLDATAKAKFLAPHVPLGPDDDTQYGYGWLFVPMPTGTLLITHNGFNGAFYTDFLRFADEDVTIFVTTNGYREADADVASELANHLFDGALASVVDAEDDSNDDQNEAEGRYCDFAELTPDSLPDDLEIEALPDSPAGRTATIFLDLLAGGDETARLDFASRWVTDEFLAGDPSIFAGDIVGLQEGFANYEVTRMLQQDDHRFHLLMQGSDPDLVLSLGFDETNPELLTCMAYLR